MTDSRGGQAARLCAFRPGYMEEYLSTGQTIVHTGSIMLQQGQTLYSNFGNPMLTLIQDTVGRHDLLLPADDARVLHHALHQRLAPDDAGRARHRVAAVRGRLRSRA